MNAVTKLRKLYVIEHWMAWGAGEPHWEPGVIWDGTVKDALLVYPNDIECIGDQDGQNPGKYRIIRIKTHEEALRFTEPEWDFSKRAVAKLQNPNYEWVE